MGLSNAIALFIIIATAATLHRAGVLDVETSAQAAEALRPVAGRFAFLRFSLGIIGTGMLAVPVLAGSAAYAVAETFKWRRGLDRKLREARGLYAIVAFATLGGIALTFSPIDPIKALFWSAVINGFIPLPVLIVMMLLAGSKKVMGEFVSGPWLKFVGWLATAVMAAAVCAMFAT
jgi:Mn2+/Fe2+ NRAMP family transporter